MSTVRLLIIAVAVLVSTCSSKKVHYVHWNRENPMFQVGNDDHILTVNEGNQPWEYDQVNIICPVSEAGARYPESHVIYSVSKSEYESCRITNPKPKIVAICNQPHKLLYFTITFRSFTPTPGGLEFKPGHDYYFISTSSKEDLHRRVGGGCSTRNMRMIFKVADNTPFKGKSSSESKNRRLSQRISTTSPAPPVFGRHRVMYDSRVPSTRGGDDYIYYYHPKDLVNMEERFKKKLRELDIYENEIWNRSEEAMKLTSAASSLNLGPLWRTGLLVTLWLSAYRYLF